MMDISKIYFDNYSRINNPFGQKQKKSFEMKLGVTFVWKKPAFLAILSLRWLDTDYFTESNKLVIWISVSKESAKYCKKKIQDYKVNFSFPWIIPWIFFVEYRLR